MRMGKSAAGDGPWQTALRRAGDAAAARPGGVDEDCWDDVAIRDIIAVVLYSLHLRAQQPVGDIPWGAVLWQLASDERVRALTGEMLPTAGHDLAWDAAPGDPVAEHWRWLSRTWDPDAPIRPRHRAPGPASGRRPSEIDGAEQVEPRWGGMSRGIGAALPDPALEICTPWAASVVGGVLLAQLGGFPKFERVRVTDGPFKDHHGYVRGAEWAFNDTTLNAEEVAYYAVDLDDVQGTELLSPASLARSRDQRWPRRTEGSLKDGPPAGLHDPLPPPSCEQDLEALLKRVSNPQSVPEELRRTIASSVRHHHLRVDWQALPAPRRVTWMLVQHWYQLTEVYAEDQRAEVWEVEFKRHLHDAEPVCHLALSEKEARAVIARHTGSSA